MAQKAENINEFWKKFHKAVLDSGVAESMAIWYVMGAEICDFIQGKAAEITEIDFFCLIF